MTVVVNQNDTVLVIAQSQNALIVGAGIQGLTGAAANVTGITGFTNGSGFTGNVTNNNLSLVLQNAAANQSGQLTADDWLLFNSTLGNVTLAQGNITDLQGNMTATQGNITSAQGNITNAQNGITNLSNHTTAINSTLNTHIGNFTNPHNVTATQLNLGNVDNTADLDKPISNATSTALGNITSNISILQGNVSNLTTDVNALNSAMRYIGGWDASSGAFPASSQAGYVYSVTVDGTVDGIDFVATDRLLSILDNASTSTYSGNWLKEDYTDKVVSVNGQVGAVNLTTANVSASTNKNYVTDSQLVNVTNLTGTNTGDQNLSGYVQDTRTINGQNLTTNITINHSTNSGLGWTNSGHTGANLTVAGFNATGAATELSISGNGTSILSNNNSDLGTPSSGNLTNCNGTAAGLTAGNVTNINVTNVTGILSVANGGTGVNATRVVAQIVTTSTGAVQTGTTTIPNDDTIPQNTEGNEFITLAITPKSATSTLVIDIKISLSNSVIGLLTAALFQDSTANALCVSARNSTTALTVHDICFQFVMTSGTTSSTTFKLRGGGANAGTTTLNGSDGGRRFGGVLISSMTITEYLP